MSDPAAATTADASQLLSPAYLAARAQQYFDATRATAVATSVTLPRPSDTVYLCVTDGAGHACSLVNSVADTFGSRIVAPGTGFALQSRGAGFHLGPAAHPNVYAPGKRPYHTIMPAVTTRARDAQLHGVWGVMGGAMQPQGHVQVLLNLTRFGMAPQAAVDAPRVCIGVSLPGKSTDPAKTVDTSVYLEEGIGADVAAALARLGHDVEVVRGMRRSLFGRGQVICVHRDPVDGTRCYAAGSDMRGDGCAGPLL